MGRILFYQTFCAAFLCRFRLMGNEISLLVLLGTTRHPA